MRRVTGPRLRTLLAVAAALVCCGGCALLVRTSVGSDGEPDGPSREPAVSADGRYVAFVSEASNLAVGDADDATDVFVRDHAGATTALVSEGIDGPPDGPSGEPAISADGRHVAFASEASNLVPGDGNAVSDVFVHDRSTGTVERVSVDGGELASPSGLPPCAGGDESCVEASRGVAISADGSQVAFLGTAGGLPAVLWRDRDSGTTAVVVVSTGPPAAPASRYLDLAMSADGGTVAITEQDTAPGGEVGLVVHERDGDVTEPVLGATGRLPDGCCHPDLSADGRFLVFTSEGRPVPEDDDVGGCPSDPVHCVLDVDVFLLDRQLEVYERVSSSSGGTEVDARAGAPTVSDDGRHVAFSSDGPLSGAAGGTDQVFVRDRSHGETDLIHAGGLGPSPAGATGAISGDGRAVVLTTPGSATPTPTGPDNLYLAATDPPVVDGVVAVEAGAAGQVVTLTGHDLRPGLVVDPVEHDVTVDAVTLVADDEVRLTVTTPPGASLGVRSLLLLNPGPHGTIVGNGCACLRVTWPYGPPAPPGGRPDVIVVNTDDQRWDSMDQLPQTSAHPDWARFTQSFVHEPQCCPSRATIFTGQYGHHNGVTTLRDGGDLDEDLTVATLLDDAGYRTFHGGKYLNGYPFGRPLYTPPGWDDFVAHAGRNQSVPKNPDGSTPLVPQYNYLHWDNDHRVTATDEPTEYATDRFFAQAREFVRQSAPDDPLFLYVAPMSPHTPFIPAARHRGDCDGRSFPTPPSFNAVDHVEDPPWLGAATPASASSWTTNLRRTCEMLQSIDEGVASLLVELEAAGRLDDAYVVFTSDNGYLFGEHRLVGKGALYEESIRVPLWVRGPGVQPGEVDRLTSNVDLVPTILDWAGVAAPAGFLDGHSFADDASGTDTEPDPPAVLLFGCRTGRAESTDCGGHRESMGTAWGVRTASHTYIRSEDGYEQLFDVVADPFQLTNLAPDPANAALLTELRELTVTMRGFDTRVSGMVRDELTGEALPGIVVGLHDGSGWTHLTTTGPSGDYTFTDLPPGPYVVRFDDPLDAHVLEFHEDRPTFATADPLVVGPVDSLVVDAHLAPI